MTDTKIYRALSALAARAITTGRIIALSMAVAFTTVAIQPAQAQTSDTWKSAAIIAGTTAAGAYIGHKVAGTTGAYVGAGIGATAGYAIDRRRRQNEAYNQGYYPDNGNNGYYDPNSGYYGNGAPYDPNGGYYGNGSPYPGGQPYQGNNYTGNTSRRSYSRHTRR